jgi:hypothetical protein
LRYKEVAATLAEGFNVDRNREFRLKTFSIVIVAKNHNPTLLNPDFLRANKIVAEDKKVIETLTTPPVSIVKYEDGLSITLESEKFQVQQPAHDEFKEDWESPQVAIAFVRTLPHVAYKGVGLNWIGIWPHENPREWLKERFVASGPWSNEDFRLNSVGIRFTYALTGESRCNLSLDAGDAKDSIGNKEPCITVSANYHHDLGPEIADVERSIMKWRSHQDHFKRLIETVLGSEGT